MLSRLLVSFKSLKSCKLPEISSENFDSLSQCAKFLDQFSNLDGLYRESGENEESAKVSKLIGESKIASILNEACNPHNIVSGMKIFMASRTPVFPYALYNDMIQPNANILDFMSKLPPKNLEFVNLFLDHLAQVSTASKMSTHSLATCIATCLIRSIQEDDVTSPSPHKDIAAATSEIESRIHIIERMIEERMRYEKGGAQVAADVTNNAADTVPFRSVKITFPRGSSSPQEHILRQYLTQTYGSISDIAVKDRVVLVCFAMISSAERFADKWQEETNDDMFPEDCKVKLMAKAPPDLLSTSAVATSVGSAQSGSGTPVKVAVKPKEDQQETSSWNRSPSPPLADISNSEKKNELNLSEQSIDAFRRIDSESEHDLVGGGNEDVINPNLDVEDFEDLAETVNPRPALAKDNGGVPHERNPASTFGSKPDTKELAGGEDVPLPAASRVRTVPGIGIAPWSSANQAASMEEQKSKGRVHVDTWASAADDSDIVNSTHAPSGQAHELASSEQNRSSSRKRIDTNDMCENDLNFEASLNANNTSKLSIPLQESRNESSVEVKGFTSDTPNGNDSEVASVSGLGDLDGDEKDQNTRENSLKSLTLSLLGSPSIYDKADHSASNAHSKSVFRELRQQTDTVAPPRLLSKESSFSSNAFPSAPFSLIDDDIAETLGKKLASQNQPKSTEVRITPSAMNVSDDSESIVAISSNTDNWLQSATEPAQWQDHKIYLNALQGKEPTETAASKRAPTFPSSIMQTIRTEDMHRLMSRIRILEAESRSRREQMFADETRRRTQDSLYAEEITSLRVQVNDVTKKLNLEKERNVQAAKQRAILEAQLSTITAEKELLERDIAMSKAIAEREALGTVLAQQKLITMMEKQLNAVNASNDLLQKQLDHSNGDLKQAFLRAPQSGKNELRSQLAHESEATDVDGASSDIRDMGRITSEETYSYLNKVAHKKQHDEIYRKAYERNADAQSQMQPPNSIVPVVKFSPSRQESNVEIATVHPPEVVLTVAPKHSDFYIQRRKQFDDIAKVQRESTERLVYNVNQRRVSSGSEPLRAFSAGRPSAQLKLAASVIEPPKPFTHYNHLFDSSTSKTRDKERASYSALRPGFVTSSLLQSHSSSSPSNKYPQQSMSTNTNMYQSHSKYRR